MEEHEIIINRVLSYFPEVKCNGNFKEKIIKGLQEKRNKKVNIELNITVKKEPEYKKILKKLKNNEIAISPIEMFEKNVVVFDELDNIDLNKYKTIYFLHYFHRPEFFKEINNIIVGCCPDNVYIYGKFYGYPSDFIKFVYNKKLNNPHFKDIVLFLKNFPGLFNFELSTFIEGEYIHGNDPIVVFLKLEEYILKEHTKKNTLKK